MSVLRKLFNEGGDGEASGYGMWGNGFGRQSSLGKNVERLMKSEGGLETLVMHYNAAYPRVSLDAIYGVLLEEDADEARVMKRLRDMARMEELLVSLQGVMGDDSGFSLKSMRKAIERTKGNIDEAVAYLFDHPKDDEEPASKLFRVTQVEEANSELATVQANKKMVREACARVAAGIEKVQMNRATLVSLSSFVGDLRKKYTNKENSVV